MRSRSHSITQLLAVLGLLSLSAHAQDGTAPDAAVGPLALETTPMLHAAPGIRFEFIPLRHVFFTHDQALLDERARQALDDAALYLKNATGIDRVIIQGHADYTAGDAYNDKLSDQRTAVVHEYLLAQGIPESLIYTGGLGEHTPIDENWTREGRARNRRVEIYIVRHADLP
jgi:OOP family OmpA-OmpF porin